MSSKSEVGRSSKRNKVLEMVNVLSYIAFVVVNLLANVIPFNGRTTAQVSDSYPNLFAPAGLTFTIWGVIYIFLALFTIYQARGYASNITNRIGYWFLLANLANIVWLPLWHYDFIPLTLIFMIILFVSLVVIYLRIGPPTDFGKENLIMRVPFSIYLGWITVATIANVTAVLVYFHWDAFGIPESIWAILVIIVGVLINLLVLWTKKDIAYSLVIVWALLGIFIKRLPDQLGVAATAGIGIVVIFIGILLIWHLKGKQDIK